MIPITEELVWWADEIVFMEQWMLDKVEQDFDLKDTITVVLEIPDKFEYRDPELMEMIRKRYDSMVKAREKPEITFELEDGTDTFTCEDCDLKFPTGNELRDHIMNECPHSITIQLIIQPLPICSNNFITSSISAYSKRVSQRGRTTNVFSRPSIGSLVFHNNHGLQYHPTKHIPTMNHTQNILSNISKILVWIIKPPNAMIKAPAIHHQNTNSFMIYTHK